MKIKEVKARQIFDSRGTPTVEVDLWLEDGTYGNAKVPSGASTGKHEACELRDGGERLFGKGVSKAVNNVNSVISSKIAGMDAGDQSKIDETLIALDGTKNKTNLGANAILGVSMACAQASANAKGVPLYRYLNEDGKFVLPSPMVNIVNGGLHAPNNLSIQEFMIVPAGFSCFKDAINAAAEIFYSLKKLFNQKKLSTAVGDEGGFAPDLKGEVEALDYIIMAIEKAGYRPGDQVFIALDSAASSFYGDGKYSFGPGEISSDELGDFYKDLIKKYPVVSIEDPFEEEDWSAFNKFNSEVGDKIQIVGDDLYVTNPELFKKGIEQKSSNAILIKLNQIGTVTETLKVISMARETGQGYIISHRSGETEDTFIADLAVASASGQIKTGSISRSERMAKYNRLIKIEQELGTGGSFKGKGQYKTR